MTRGLQLPTAPGTRGLQLPTAPRTRGLQLPTAPGTRGLQLPTAPGTRRLQLPTAPGTRGLQFPTAPRTRGLQLPIAPGSILSNILYGKLATLFGLQGAVNERRVHSEQGIQNKFGTRSWMMKDLSSSRMSQVI